jgi:hypothetical protein
MPPIGRPLLAQLDTIAQEIHKLYLQDQLEERKGSAPEQRAWDELPEDIKYSKLSQARQIVEKLRLIGCALTRIESGSILVSAFSEDEIEYLAQIEHDRWMEERQSSGWVYGPTKDATNRVSPYLVAWDQLADPIKDLDRNAVRNIIGLLGKVGLGVCRVA